MMKDLRVMLAKEPIVGGVTCQINRLDRDPISNNVLSQVSDNASLRIFNGILRRDTRNNSEMIP